MHGSGVWMVALLLGGSTTTDSVHVVQTWLKSGSQQRSAAELPQAQAANAEALQQVPAAPACGLPPPWGQVGWGTPSVVAEKSGPYVVVQWPTGHGGTDRQRIRVAAGSVVPVAPLLAAAQGALSVRDLATALERVNQATALDPDSEEALALLARVHHAMGHNKEAAAALAKARAAWPDGTGWRYAAAVMQPAGPQRDRALDDCMNAVRGHALADGRCFALRAVEHRRSRDLQLTQGLLEGALLRNPQDPSLLAARALLTHALANGARSADRALLLKARSQARPALACAQALEPEWVGALNYAVAQATLEAADGPCAAQAERALLEDPAVPEHRAALDACAQCAHLLANQRLRQGNQAPEADTAWESQRLLDALMQPQPQVCGRKLPAFKAYQRVRIRMRPTQRGLEITLRDVEGHPRRSPALDAAAAAFMVAQVYTALYGADAPTVLVVGINRAGQDTLHTVDVHPSDISASQRPTDEALKDLAAAVRTDRLD